MAKNQDRQDGKTGPAKSNDSAAMPAWVSIALGELGQAEVPGTGDNPKIVEYHRTTRLPRGLCKDSVAWCSSLVNWSMERAGVRGTGSAAAASWEAWGVPCRLRIGAVVVIYNPAMRGTNLTRSGKHVGFCYGGGKRKLVLLGGNQGNRVSCKIFDLRKWRILAIRWPA